jgi:cyanate lyase
MTTTTMAATLTRSETTELLLQAKARKGVTFKQIADVVGAHEVWVTSCMFGQNSMPAPQAKALAKYLELGDEVAVCLQGYPMKGSLDQAVPVDPLIYRFHEITQVYGTTIKALIHEKFGDGIMSAIDFEMHIEKKEDPKGDRVIVTYNGKFLPYKKW